MSPLEPPAVGERKNLLTNRRVKQCSVHITSKPPGTIEWE